MIASCILNFDVWHPHFSIQLYMFIAMHSWRIRKRSTTYSSCCCAVEKTIRSSGSFSQLQEWLQTCEIFRQQSKLFYSSTGCFSSITSEVLSSNGKFLWVFGGDVKSANVKGRVLDHSAFGIGRHKLTWFYVLGWRFAIQQFPSLCSQIIWWVQWFLSPWYTDGLDMLGFWLNNDVFSGKLRVASRSFFLL